MLAKNLYYMTKQQKLIAIKTRHYTPISNPIKTWEKSFPTDKAEEYFCTFQLPNIHEHTCVFLNADTTAEEVPSRTLNWLRNQS